MMKNIHKFMFLLSILAISSCTDYPDEIGYNIQSIDNVFVSVSYLVGSATSETYDVKVTKKYNIVEEVTNITSAYIVISEVVTESKYDRYYQVLAGTDKKWEAEVTREGDVLTVSGEVQSSLVPGKTYKAYLYLGNSDFIVLRSASKVFKFVRSTGKLQFYDERYP